MNNPDEVKIPCPCCDKKIYIDLRIFDRYRKAMVVINIADSHTQNFLYPTRFKHPKIQGALTRFYGRQPAHYGPAVPDVKTWKFYIIDLILSNANIRSLIKYIKDRINSGE